MVSLPINLHLAKTLEETAVKTFEAVDVDTQLIHDNINSSMTEWSKKLFWCFSQDIVSNQGVLEACSF